MTKEKKRFPCELGLVFGLLLASFAVTLMVHSDLGASTLSGFPLALSIAFPIFSFGIWNFAVQTMMILILVISTRSFKLGYIVAFFIGNVYGLLLDFYRPIVDRLPRPLLALDALYYFSGVLLLALGASFFMRCKLPVLPFDTFTRDFSAHFRLRIKVVKTVYDVSSVAVTLLISIRIGYFWGIVGPGTIFCALALGSFIQAICGWFDRHLVFEPFVPLVARMMKL